VPAARRRDKRIQLFIRREGSWASVRCWPVAASPIVMDLDRAIRTRRSVRRFRDTPVPETLIDELLDLARHAPSAMNGQPWRFLVVRDAATKATLERIKLVHCPPEKQSYPPDFLAQAPVVVVVAVEEARAHGRAVEDAALAAAVVLLAAHARGLGSVYSSGTRAEDPGLEAEIQKALGLPRDVRPIAILPLGFPAESPREKALRPLGELVGRVPGPHSD